MKTGKLKNFKEELNNSAIELYGNKRVIIFDCKSVIDYSDEIIILDLNTVKLKIKGENLTVDSFVFGQTDISGEICGLEFV